jgi:hypothetical protein
MSSCRPGLCWHDGGVTVADDHLVRIGAGLDGGYREHAAAEPQFDQRLPDCARDALALFDALQPIDPITIRLGAGQVPGVDVSEDASWAASVALARHDVLAKRAAGIDHGLSVDSLRLLDRIDALVAVWPDSDWDVLVRRRVQERVDARQHGAQRGQEMRDSRQDVEPEDDFEIGWLLRHPTDHWLRQAAPTVSDAQCRALIEAQVAKLAASYDQLGDLDWAAQEAVADVICEMHVGGAAGRWIGWEQPVSAVVTAAVKGAPAVDQQIAVRLVEDPDDGMFNGTLVSLLAGESWRLCARELADGTLLPLDGTRRVATPSA